MPIDIESGAVMEALRIDPFELVHRLRSGEALTLLDVRGPASWRDGLEMIPGAQHVDPFQFAIDPNWPVDQLTVLYCDCLSDGTSAELAQQLADAGFTKVFALRGGLEAWKLAGGPVQPKK
jgi:rhodanese-related sulfurtransferase